MKPEILRLLIQLDLDIPFAQTFAQAIDLDLDDLLDSVMTGE